TRFTQLVVHRPNLTCGWFYFAPRKFSEQGKSTHCCIILCVLLPFLSSSLPDKPKNTSVSVSPSGEIVEGSSVTLTCSSDANPPVDKYTWYKKNVTSPKASGQSYSITNIISEDRGEYYCEAENKYGRLNSSSVSVDVQYTTTLFLWVPVMGVGAALTVGALLVTIYCYMKRRHTGGSDATSDTQSVHPDPNSDMYTALNMKTRPPEYDTLANVRGLPSDTAPQNRSLALHL
uniref:Ig-like domain-containing protein n=1 Tax=Oncorhynchus kisutch TaxID=8019 RepID=A0A8C7JL31_ONCKI